MGVLRDIGLRGLGCVLALLAPPGFAGLIEDTVTLSTSGQSMWKSGSESILSEETFLGAKWGTYDGGAPERLAAGAIVGEENYRVPGTGGTLPNPARVLWDGAMATCQVGASFSTCVNGTSAVRACAPSWLGGGCTTVIPAIPGLGNPPPATIDNPIDAQFVDTRTGLEGGIETSGEAGIIPWVEATAGAIDVNLPFDATIDIPDAIAEGEEFSISTSYSVLDDAEITANAPSFKAGVDGIFNSDNDLFGTACFIGVGCDEGSVPADVKPGRFGIVSIDTTEDNFLRVGGGERGEGSLGVPGIAFDEQYNFHAPSPTNPDGVDDDTTPQTVPTPRLGDFMVSNPQDLSGGEVAGNQVGFSTHQQLLSLNASITGIGELVLGSPGILSNSIDVIGPIGIDYTILDVAAGPRFGVAQDFSIDPNAFVRLEFDQPILQRSPDVVTIEERLVARLVCVSSFFGTCFKFRTIVDTVFDVTVTPGEVFESRFVEIALGDGITLSFAGEIGNLIGREYFLKDPTFSNRTGATVDPGLKIELGCIGVLGFEGCVFKEDYATEGLIDITVFDDSWILGGFNTVAFAGSVSTNPGGSPGGSVPVPAPSVMVLLGSGLLLLGLRRRRRTLEHVQ